MSQSSKGQLSSVRKALKILSSFSTDESEIGVTQMAHALDISKGSASKLAAVLEDEGFLQRTANRKYRLGLSCLTLSGIITTNNEIYNEAKPNLRKLVETVRETVHLSILDGNMVTYLLIEECNHPVMILTHVGRKNPIHATSSGKVLLAFQSAAQQETIIEKGLKIYTDNTITSPKVFRSHLNQVRKQGYATDINEHAEGVVSVAAPVRNYLGQVVAAVSIVGPIQRMDKTKIPYYVKRLIPSANSISASIGYMINT